MQATAFDCLGNCPHAAAASLLNKIPNIHPNPITHNLTMPPQHRKELLFHYYSPRIDSHPSDSDDSNSHNCHPPILLSNTSTPVFETMSYTNIITPHQNSGPKDQIHNWVLIFQLLTTTCNSHLSPNNTSRSLLRHKLLLQHHFPSESSHI